MRNAASLVSGVSSAISVRSVSRAEAEAEAVSRGLGKGARTEAY
jgi:hypothetical protein